MKKIISAVKAIASGFNDLINFIQMIFKLVFDLLQQIVLLIRYILQANSIALSFIYSMPNWIKVFATITIAISVLYIILNRQGGKN